MNLLGLQKSMIIKSHQVQPIFHNQPHNSKTSKFESLPVTQPLHRPLVAQCVNLQVINKNLCYSQNKTPFFIGLIQFLTNSFMNKIQILLLHEKAQRNFLQVVFWAILKLWGGCAPSFLTPHLQKKNLYYILT